MHAVLHVLDRELQVFLDPPEEERVPAFRDRDVTPDGVAAPETP
jgi:hypothetical protein